MLFDAPLRIACTRLFSSWLVPVSVPTLSRVDNMAPTMLAEAVALVAGRAATEASGGVRLDNIGAIAASGVDYVSVGRLMQSAPAADIGLDFELV